MRRGAVVADMFCQDLSRDIVVPLIVGFAQRMKDQAKEWMALSFFGSADFESHFSTLGFTPGGPSTEVFSYVNPEASTSRRREIFEKDRWFLFGGEFDVLLSHEVWPGLKSARSGAG
jgi:hypothetical protein